MDDYLEIDIKKIIKKLLLQWYWILGITLIIGFLTFLNFYLKDDFYESRSRIALIEPRFQAQFQSNPSPSDPSLTSGSYNTNITTSRLAIPSESLISSAVTSDKVILQLFSEWSNPDKNEISLENFVENNLEVSLESKGSIITLAVKAQTSEEAADLSNIWVKLAIEQINSTFFSTDEDMIAYFQEQMENAKSTRDNSGEALVEFAAQDNSEFLQIQLDNLNMKASETLQRRRVLEAAESDIMGILAYVESLSPDVMARQRDLLNFTLIQSRIYGSSVLTGQADSPVQLQIVVDPSQEDLTNSEFIEVLNGWSKVIRSEMSNLDSAHAALGPEISALQSMIKEIQLERNLLDTDYSLNESTYKTLKTKLEEVKLDISFTAGGNAILVNRAYPTQEALPHNTVRNTLIALVASVVLVSLLILVVDWWKSDNKKEE